MSGTKNQGRRCKITSPDGSKPVKFGEFYKYSDLVDSMGRNTGRAALVWLDSGWLEITSPANITFIDK